MHVLRFAHPSTGEHSLRVGHHSRATFTTVSNMLGASKFERPNLLAPCSVTFAFADSPLGTMQISPWA